MLLLATAILFSFQHVSLNSFSCNFPQQKRFHHNFFKSFEFSVDFFAFSIKIPVCLFLNFPQMFMAVLKSNSESSGPCIETIINPCNMVLVSLFFLNVVFTLDIQLNPLSHSIHQTNESYNYVIRSGTWILTCPYSQIFFCIYQLKIGTKSVFEFHNYRSVLFHGI